MSASIQKNKRAYLEMHFAVVLFGMTAIFGVLISISALSIVWWRVGITALSLALFSNVFRELKTLTKHQILSYSIIGMIIGLHWVCFYASVKLSNASIALICMATISIFTAFIEPLFLRSTIQRVDVIFGLAIIPAMWFIVENLSFSMYAGVMVGILSSVLLAIATTLNKKNISDVAVTSITFVEMAAAWLLLSFLLPFQISVPDQGFLPTELDWVYLLLLAILCTTFAFTLNLRALRHISAFTANYILNLEPLYGILFAVVILNEHRQLNKDFYWGVLLISILVFTYPLAKRYAQK